MTGGVDVSEREAREATQSPRTEDDHREDQAEGLVARGCAVRPRALIGSKQAVAGWHSHTT